MDYARIAKIHDEIFSMPPNSKERMEKLEKLSEVDRERLFDFDMGLYSGRTKKPKNYEQEENGTMTYEQFVKKSESDEKGVMQELSQFAMKSPELYQRYREKWQAERSEQQRLHNRRLTENTFKNKPFSVR